MRSVGECRTHDQDPVPTYVTIAYRLLSGETVKERYASYRCRVCHYRTLKDRGGE